MRRMLDIVVAFLPIPATLFLSLLWALSVEAVRQQSPLSGFSGHHICQDREQIAIIGAGIGGASVAFDRHERGRNSPSGPRVTIFDREDEVGGRIKSRHLYPVEGRRKMIEQGATHFYAGDWCITSAMDNVGLKPTLPLPWPASWSTAHWREDDVRKEIKCNAELSAWQHRLHGIWMYGSSWCVFQSAVSSAVDAWNSFASPYTDTFTSITQALTLAGLPPTLYGPAKSFLQSLSVSPVLREEFIQPCVRGRISQNLSASSGLSALLAAGQSSTVSIHGGNGQLVEKLIRLSKADLQTNALVTAISPGKDRRYQLSISHLTSQKCSRAEILEFDTVILAAPLQSANLDLSRLSLPPTVIPSPGIETHVTHFSSPVAISTNLSLLPLDISIQGEMTLTTSNNTSASHVVNLHQSSACFKRTACLPDDECDECDEDTFLYRVHSDRHLVDEELVQMIGQEWRAGSELDDYGIHYVRRQAWPYSYPEGGTDFVDEVEIAPNFWYLNGAESIVSSMEMSCRMARNVAKQGHRRK